MKRYPLLFMLIMLSAVLAAFGNSPSTKLNVSMTDFKYDKMDYSVPA